MRCRAPASVQARGAGTTAVNLDSRAAQTIPANGRVKSNVTGRNVVMTDVEKAAVNACPAVRAVVAFALQQKDKGTAQISLIVFPRITAPDNPASMNVSL